MFAPFDTIIYQAIAMQVAWKYCSHDSFIFQVGNPVWKSEESIFTQNLSKNIWFMFAAQNSYSAE